MKSISVMMISITYDISYLNYCQLNVTELVLINPAEIFVFVSRTESDIYIIAMATWFYEPLLIISADSEYFVIIFLLELSKSITVLVINYFVSFVSDASFSGSGTSVNVKSSVGLNCTDLISEEIKQFLETEKPSYTLVKSKILSILLAEVSNLNISSVDSSIQELKRWDI